MNENPSFQLKLIQPPNSSKVFAIIISEAKHCH